MSSMPDPDDRGDALKWYFRLLVEQALERGATRSALYERMGVEKGHLSQIENGKVGIGVPKLIAFAPAFGLTPGQLLDSALLWWPKNGREYRDRKLSEQQAMRVAPAEEVPDSGHRPSDPHLRIAR